MIQDPSKVEQRSRKSNKWNLTGLGVQVKYDCYKQTAGTRMSEVDDRGKTVARGQGEQECYKQTSGMRSLRADRLGMGSVVTPGQVKGGHYEQTSEIKRTGVRANTAVNDLYPVLSRIDLLWPDAGSSRVITRLDAVDLLDFCFDDSLVHAGIRAFSANINSLIL